MNENYYPRCRVWAYAAWMVVAALLAAAWLVMLLDWHDWRIAGLLAFSACTGSAVAATLHIRSFMVRVCSLVRAASIRRNELDGEGLHSVG